MSNDLIQELEALVELWDDPEYADKFDYYAQIGLNIAKKDLQQLIDEYKE